MIKGLEHLYQEAVFFPFRDGAFIGKIIGEDVASAHIVDESGLFRYTFQMYGMGHDDKMACEDLKENFAMASSDPAMIARIREFQSKYTLNIWAMRGWRDPYAFSGIREKGDPRQTVCGDFEFYDPTIGKCVAPSNFIRKDMMIPAFVWGKDISYESETDKATLAAFMEKYKR